MCHAVRCWVRPFVALCCAFLFTFSTIVTAPARAEIAAIEVEVSESPQPSAEALLAVPTHKQTAIIRANLEGQPQVSLTCFCLTPDDRIVAGCTGQANELRVFDAEGKYLETWSAPVNPEAIYVCEDGRILVAGEGQLVRLTSSGQVELQKQAPHAAAINANPDKIREEVVQQHKQRAEQFAQQTQMFDQAIERADKDIAQIKEQLTALEKAETDAADGSAEEADAAAKKTSPRPRMNKDMLNRRLATLERTKKQYEQVKADWGRNMGNAPSAELTEEQIEQQVKSSIGYKLKASSVSATGDEVFLATRALAGYGYEIWRMDQQFENGTRIVSELRGCCGQMDVKASEHGLFVAENSRHRVCRFDREGKSLTTWGHGAREGIEGFGSCCNPMNVAFGPDDAVYTAEDTTGRIKRYSVDGKLLGVVGKVDLVPGCKNVSIAVSTDGSRVYMLDITRHHIVRLDARPADEVISQALNAPQTAETGGVGSAIGRGLIRLLGGGN